jgi:hypothetical protein
MPFGLLAPRSWLPSLCPLVYLLPDFGYPLYALWFTCSQILATLFMPFGLLAPKDFLFILLLYHFTMNVPDERYLKNNSRMPGSVLILTWGSIIFVIILH